MPETSIQLASPDTAGRLYRASLRTQLHDSQNTGVSDIDILSLLRSSARNLRGFPMLIPQTPQRLSYAIWSNSRHFQPIPLPDSMSPPLCYATNHVGGNHLAIELAEFASTVPHLAHGHMYHGTKNEAFQIMSMILFNGEVGWIHIHPFTWPLCIQEEATAKSVRYHGFSQVEYRRVLEQSIYHDNIEQLNGIDRTNQLHDP
ncbi:hypothetical protein BU24DRAFT_419775 [Aaosphaeria arxii CBS 175.79]|uniref:Uncharacterized protein n=1 Tax=Aaosphaeria arxii CBS 175.79 TaxID=1450172 RepID=A0A6A5Y4R9_9PLEO|nr:uncharacterized protein BU24DRAFT_419775 [Aaosphaeria arxii CBS 175.79]KAF2020203.1 hypothetical protein BU24DRAFT_419775 [Aaosphaeria arxii CBS 175.79]